MSAPDEVAFLIKVISCSHSCCFDSNARQQFIDRDYGYVTQWKGGIDGLVVKYIDESD